MEFRLLGPVELWVRGAQQVLPSTKLKQLLAALLWDVGQMVSTQTLVRRLWDEDAPPHELASLHSNVSRLRGRLAQAEDPGVKLEHISLGYRLLVPNEAIDLVQFKRESAAARAAVEAGRIDDAIRLLRAAESLVRGEPLSGLPGNWARDTRGQLDEETREVTLQRIELQLNVRPSSSRELLAELHRLAAEREFDESVLDLRMRALHLAGRTTEALLAYNSFRTRLREHSGLDPGVTSQRIYQQLLHDESEGVGGTRSTRGTPDLRGTRGIRDTTSLVTPSTAGGASPPLTTSSASSIPASSTALSSMSSTSSSEAPTAETRRPPAGASPPTAARPSPPPSTLDRDPPGFVGRQHDIEAISAEIDRQWESDAPVVCVIDGMPAIGKSTLALFLAHRLRDRCPDGAFQLNLRSHDERRSPTTAETALDLLLSMLGVDPEPAGARQAAGLDRSMARWRKAIAGKRLLLVLDDVSEPEQIQPLLPTGRGCIVLITARTRLPGLPDAIRHPLHPLEVRDSVKLFLNSARMAPTSDPALSNIVRSCGGIPLAVSVAGNAMRAHQSWSLSDVAEELVGTHGSQQLDSIIAPALYRSFATSYRDLPEFERKLFRRLSLNPGSRIHQHAAATLVDASASETHNALYNLVEQNLLEEPVRRYYRMHDMVRLYAAHVCEIDEEPAERDRAADRLVRYTLAAVDAAARLYHPYRHVCLMPIDDAAAPGEDRRRALGLGFTDAKQAGVWLESEQEWLRTVAEHWFFHGRAAEAATLVHMLARYMDRTSRWKEILPLHEASLRHWRNAEDEVGEAHALIDLAVARWRLGAADQALEHAHAALSISARLGDPGVEADALLQIGRVHHSKHNHGAAIEALKRCAELRREDADLAGLASALHHLGTAEFDAGHYLQSVATVEQALGFARAAQDIAIERNCVNSLGTFCLRLDDHQQARFHYQWALELATQMGDRPREADVAFNLGECEMLLNRPETAGPLLERAFEIFETLGDLSSQADVMIVQAQVQLELGRAQSARATLDAAASMCESVGDPLQLSHVHMAYGHFYLASGDYHIAMQAYRQAGSFGRLADNSIMQARAEHRIGDIYERFGKIETARRHWHKGLLFYGEGFPSPATDVLREKLVPRTPRRAAS